jgi:hypothetical protein
MASVHVWGYDIVWVLNAVEPAVGAEEQMHVDLETDSSEVGHLPTVSSAWAAKGRGGRDLACQHMFGGKVHVRCEAAHCRKHGQHEKQRQQWHSQ